MGSGAAQEHGQPSLKAINGTLPTISDHTSPAIHSNGKALIDLVSTPPASSSAINLQHPARNQLSERERVQRKWQMASVAHFFEVFKDVIPLKEISEDTYEDLTPSLLEGAVVEPEVDARACLALRDLIMTLLLTIGAATRKSLATTWFQSLRVLVGSNRAAFLDCYDHHENVLGRFENGMDFVTNVDWNVRLGMMLSLCDVAAETSQSVRDAIREAELECTHQKSAIDTKGYRLLPIGRCSKRRVHYKVGKTRIYSGYKRKGTGALLAECSDSESMKQLAAALESTQTIRDQTLASRIRDIHLAPLIELEEKNKKKLEKTRLAEIRKEESRRRNSARPRRSKASYF